MNPISNSSALWCFGYHSLFIDVTNWLHILLTHLKNNSNWKFATISMFYANFSAKITDICMHVYILWTICKAQRGVNVISALDSSYNLMCYTNTLYLRSFEYLHTHMKRRYHQIRFGHNWNLLYFCSSTLTKEHPKCCKSNIFACCSCVCVCLHTIHHNVYVQILSKARLHSHICITLFCFEENVGQRKLFNDLYRKLFMLSSFTLNPFCVIACYVLSSFLLSNGFGYTGLDNKTQVLSFILDICSSHKYILTWSWRRKFAQYFCCDILQW